MKVKMTRKELQVLKRTLDLYKNATGAKFTYALTKNKSIINSELKELDNMSKGLSKDEKFMEYEEKRMDLCKKHCNRDENNKPIIINGQFDLSNKLPEFELDFSNLNEEYKELLDAKEVIREEIEEYRNKEIELELHGINFEDIPNTIQQHQMDAIIFLIVDKEDESKKLRLIDTETTH